MYPFFQSREAKTAKKHKIDKPNFTHLSEGKYKIYNEIIGLLVSIFLKAAKLKQTKTTTFPQHF